MEKQPEPNKLLVEKKFGLLMGELNEITEFNKIENRFTQQKQ